MRLLFFSAAISACLGQDIDLSLAIGSTHWQPCYYLNASLPSLLDGAVALATTGTRVGKFSFNAGDFPWNSPLWPDSFPDMVTQAKHPYWSALFSNSGWAGSLPTSYQTFVLVAYSQGPKAGSFCGTYTQANEEEDRKQFSDLTQYFITTYNGKGLRFIAQSWENDWAVRCGSYDANKPVPPQILDNYRRWLQARQDGVTGGRVQACLSMSLSGWTNKRCVEEEYNFMQEVGVEVYHAAEVNLVLTSLESGHPNNINTVIPNVALDMISYSSYDCMATRSFGQCLDFIADHHNATAASPINAGLPAVTIGEYGVAETYAPPGTVEAVSKNVVAFALSTGNGTTNSKVRRADYALYWELYDNEVINESYDRCTKSTGPVFNMSNLSGFWVIRPDGTKAYMHGYMSGLINGTIAPPLPPSPPSGICTYTDNTDIDDTPGSELTNIASKEDCCQECEKDPLCGASVYVSSDQQCWKKQPGGTPIQKNGVVACFPT
jgi:hypothetical protein